jgi:hypothetical protein
MNSTRTRRLLLGGTVTLVAGWLGLMALVAPALLGAVAAATLLPLTLVALPYLAVGAVVRMLDARRPAPRSDAGRAEDAVASSTARSDSGTAEGTGPSTARNESGTTAAD